MKQWFLAAFFALIACDSQASLPLGSVTITPQGAQPIHVSVEVADTENARATGLMDRNYMPEDKGMIFIFPDNAIRTFWMHHTLIPLDIIFIDSDGKIVSITKSARPNDDTTISSRFPAIQALELNAGMATRWHLAEGDMVLLDKTQGNN